MQLRQAQEVAAEVKGSLQKEKQRGKKLKACLNAELRSRVSSFITVGPTCWSMGAYTITLVIMGRSPCDLETAT